MEITESVDYDDRLAAIENRVRNMDALVKGLIAELLDLRTVTMATSRQEAEYTRQELVQGTAGRGVAPAGSSSPVTAAAPEEETTVLPDETAPQETAPAGPAMVRIMQPDGTMKLEPRYGDEKTTGTTAGYGRTLKRSTAANRQDTLH